MKQEIKQFKEKKITREIGIEKEIQIVGVVAEEKTT